ncbi:MAG TPA: NAD(P)H-quinone oxidoreductase [Pseudonocardiaceae bacterium]|jgi:putative PIG3 family NAD(P)H quinone oxidoreductase|nr:NAD(P)H-quinone oxidoreductase [Pseudonocardiaceae bacterium]
MHAITISQPGGPEVLTWSEVPDPQAGPGEVVVDVAAAGVNRADLLQRQGFYPPPPGASDVLGLECSGTISEVGPDVTGWHVGDQVCALLAGGGYAQRVAVPAGQLLPVPTGVDLISAAALPEVACTVWSNVVMLAHLTAGETLLVHGGAGGIGTHAIQVGKALGATVAVTAGSAERLAHCRELGADILINYRDQDFVRELADGADVILDNMGAKYLARNIEALAPNGRLAVIGMQGGATAELNLRDLMGKRGTIISTTLRARPVADKARIVADVTARLWPLVADGRVKPVVGQVLPIEQAGDGHRIMERSQAVGKILLRAN